MSEEREVMVWDELGEGVRDLARRIHVYTGVDERLPAPMILSPVPELIADDVADTRTLALVRDLCAVTEELAPTARPVNG